MENHGIKSSEEFYQRYTWPCNYIIMNATASASIKLDLCQHGTVVPNAVYPACYQFRNLPSQTLYGLNTGLMMKLRVPQTVQDLRGTLKPSFSMILFHPKHSQVADENTIVVPQNSDVQISIHQLNISRKKSFGWPKNKELCRDLLADESNLHCELRCFGLAFYNECGCVFHGARWALPEVNSSSCLLWTLPCAASKQGTENVMQHINDCKGDCLPLCEEVTYDRTVSQRQREDSAGFATVKVGYNTLSYSTMYEKDPYDIINVVSNIGGHVGLWLGWSFLTIIHWALLQCFKPRNINNRNNAAK